MCFRCFNSAPVIFSPQSHGQPVDSSASPVFGCAAHGACAAPLRAVPGCQHGLCAHAAHVHGEASGLGKHPNTVG